MTQIITPERLDKGTILKNFYSILGVYGAIWVIFYLSTVFFFGFIVGSPLLVGIFLGIGNIWAMLADIPIGTIQRQIPSKTMLTIANSMMILVAIIFLYFVRTSGGIGVKIDGDIFEVTRTFLSSTVNIILLLIVGVLYGSIQEFYDVTTIAYVMNVCDPTEYDAEMSKLNVIQGAGAGVGMLLSIVILSFRTNSVEIILFILIFLLGCMTVYIQTYFDNSSETFNLSSVTNLHLIERTKKLEETTNKYVKTTISTGDFQKIKGDMSYIILKPKEIAQKIDWGSMIQKTKNEFKSLYTLIINSNSFVPILLWTTGGIFVFGCWDTIVMTFFINYLEDALKEAPELKNIIQSGFILIGLLAVPAYGLQLFFIKQSDKFGKFNVIAMGFCISAVALFGLAIFNNVGNNLGVAIIVFFAILNSVGYAAGSPMSNSIFADEYNKAYSKAMGLSVIDTDVSAAPLKMLNNLANAFGLILGGALITFIGFNGMFIAYGCFVLFWATLSIKKRIAWNLDQK